ncbi:MAG: 50S ribosomal protein L21 [Candidatus Zixiibacteriota bacterium]
MFAIVNIKGDQERLEIGRKILVPYMSKKNPGDEIILENVMLLSDGDEVEVGQPYIEGLSFKTKVVDHARGKKVIAFKKKRRTGYKRKIGHVQKYTELEILEMLKGQKVVASKPAEENKPQNNNQKEQVDESPKEG